MDKLCRTAWTAWTAWNTLVFFGIRLEQSRGMHFHGLHGLHAVSTQGFMMSFQVLCRSAQNHLMTEYAEQTREQLDRVCEL